MYVPALVFAGMLALPVYERPSVAPERCRPAAETSAPNLIKSAITALGLDRIGDRVRSSSTLDAISMAFQSDRMYPPYLFRTAEQRVYSDWTNGLLRTEQGSGQNAFGALSDSARRALLPPRGGAPLLTTRQTAVGDERALDPWMVLADWRGATDVLVSGECFYRDYWRTVLTRKTSAGEERLFIDTKTGFPVKLDRQDPYTLFGDVHTEYVWQIWMPVGPALAPQFVFRMIDGQTDQQRRISQYTLIARDSAPALQIPAEAKLQPPPAFATPDTVRISTNTFALTTPAYTNVVTLQRDTIFILDAQTSEARARADSVWIGKLFTGRHPLVLVVTDLAWPHISGVRFWVANGATVVSHRASREFLTRVVERKWTVAPDLLEQRRARIRFAFRSVEEGMDLAGGALRLRPIDGIGSEGALLAYLQDDRFLYPGDYIQNGGPTSFTASYAREVANAVRKAGFAPERFIAMHVKLTSWSALASFTGN